MTNLEVIIERLRYISKHVLDDDNSEDFKEAFPKMPRLNMKLYRNTNSHALTGRLEACLLGYLALDPVMNELGWQFSPYTELPVYVRPGQPLKADTPRENVYEALDAFLGAKAAGTSETLLEIFGTGSKASFIDSIAMLEKLV